MSYTWYEVFWFFLLYSFAGWVIGTSGAALKEKKFIDVGFLFGPWCPSYGFGAVGFALFLPELKEQPVFLFAGGVILSFIITSLTGLTLKRIFHQKWKDYSRRRFNFGGYVNLPYTVVWGAAALLCIWIVNPFLSKIIGILPYGLGKVILIIAYVVIVIDFIGTISGILSVHIRLARLGKLVLVEEVADNLQKAADYMGNGLTGWVLKHLEKSHEGLEIKEIIRSKLQRREKAQEMTGVFAAGCGFYKLFWLFFLGSFLGDITETIFCWWKMGAITSRSSVVYGPFSLVWGIGCFFLTYMLYQYRDRSDSFIFIFGTVLGGAYEYICSVVLELVFGTVFWDYSKIPFNLGGRINLLYCFFWGIAAVVWMKILYPKLSGFIEKIPKKIGVPLTWFLVVFMVFDMAISGLALNRYHERHQKAATPENAITKILDTRFPDKRMERIYPSAKHVK